jgi:hypothetical protein
MAILLLIHPITHSLTRSLTLSFFSPNKISPLHPHLLAMIFPPSIYIPNLHLHPEKKQTTSASLGRKIGLALQPLTATINLVLNKVLSDQFIITDNGIYTWMYEMNVMGETIFWIFS